MAKQLIKVSLLSLLCFNIIISGIIIASHGSAQSSIAPRALPRIYVDPQNETANVGDFFTIDVKIADIEDLYGFEIGFRWAPAVLKYVSRTVKVPVDDYPDGVLYDPAFNVKDELNETHGVSGTDEQGTLYKLTYACLDPAPSFNGSGIIFNMTFQVIRDGEGNLSFTHTALSDTNSIEINHKTEAGYFYQPGLGQLPVADFTVVPNPPVATKDTVFNASMSYDPDFGGNIALYMWIFGDGTVTNSTSPLITHNFTATGRYNVGLTVLDDQGEDPVKGSQSNPIYRQLTVIKPNPVAEFDVTPEDQIGVVNGAIIFDGSASFDPDPEGGVVSYTWDFADENTTTTLDPITSHRFNATGDYLVGLIVNDTEGLLSNPYRLSIEIVNHRGLQVVDVSVSPSELKQGEEATVDFTVANRGEADESFNVTAYYNTSSTEWVPIGQLPIQDLPKQLGARWEFTPSSAGETVNKILADWTAGARSKFDDTRITVGTDTGFWTVNPRETNLNNSSPGLVTGTPLQTGGWIWGNEGIQTAETLHGDMPAGNWTFTLRLYATEANVTATLWTRVLKTNAPDPQAAETTCTVVKDWTSILSPILLPTVNTTFTGTVPMPALLLTHEYLYIEFQLEVTENLAVNNETTVIVQIGGPTGAQKFQIAGTTFSSRGQHTLYWDTEFASVGNHVVRVTADSVPFEIDTNDNTAFSSSILVTERPAISPLDITVDVGSIHFRGEIAEFFTLVTSSGKAVSVTEINATLLYNHEVSPINPADIEEIATGVYLIRYEIPIDASPGTYAMLIESTRVVAERNTTQDGTALRTFLLSPTLSGWNATLIGVSDELATLSSLVGEIQVNLTAINATLTSIFNTGKGEILAEIDTAIGSLRTRLDNINATVIAIDGNTATIDSTLGEIEVSIGSLQSVTATGLVASSILSAIAAIAAVLLLLRARG
ncbi:MAG: PKD domain-containing protein [Candidatus Bathyarchaeota archaeon]|nr:MAG: PKD domain-containing protein [Candidatus Bathyarchaeota archaeon]